MFEGKTFLAVIPARGGSKRLPKKNILDLAGKPMIAWSIDAGIQSKYIDQTVVSSDDTEILNIAKKYGSETVARPAELASDTATTFDALKHVLENAGQYDYIVLLQPTSPLRKADDIDNAIELLIQKEADAVVSVSEMEHSPLWANTLPDDKNMHNFLDEKVLNKRSQELEKYYRLNGAIYICKTEKLLAEGSFLLRENCFAYEMPKERSVDIDTRFDFEIANYLLPLSM